jgi:hypothetical protein
VLFGAAIDAGAGFDVLALSGVVFIIGSALLAFLVPVDKLAR